MSIELRQAAQQALKALEAISDEMTTGERYTNAGQYLLDALGPLRAALSQQPAKGEPMLSTDIAPRPLSYSLDDYHRAPSEGAPHYTWQDKPHRLLYDLIAAVAYYAGKQPATPEPVKVVPYNPTTEMMFSMKGLDPTLSLSQCRELWSVAWKAAPTNHPAPSAPGDVVRDAERYRWLLDNGALGFSGAPSWRVSVSFDAMDAYAQTLDSNIDAAMLAANEGSK